MDKFYWADSVAERIIKEKGKKKQYICASGITPSGIIHIGNFREVITTDLVVRALRDKGKKVRFIYSWDDYDRFRKVPVNIPKSYEKYIGMPLSDVPSPVKGKGKSYAEFFEKSFEKDLELVGIKPVFIRQNTMNKQSKYAKLIKIALDNIDKIVEILNKYRKEPLAKDWLPIMVYCEKCKKDFTKILNIRDYEIEYECKCGHKAKFDFRKKGLVSVRWRVDWPMRWAYEKVDFEPGGIDHSVQGGSYTTAQEIVKIFNFETPIYQFYDWIKPKGGMEFSSSTGNVLTLGDVEEIYEPEILRYLFAGTRPNKGFQISFDNDVIKIYEDYDTLEKKYFEGDVNDQEKRIYELSQVKKTGKKQPKKESFRHLITLIQSGKAKANDIRTEKVKNWLEKYAGDDMKFEVQDKVNIKLGNKERKALIELREALKKNDYSEDELFNKFYEICEKISVFNKDFFTAAYKALIGKEKGPRLTHLVSAIGKDKVIKILNTIN